MTTFVVRVCVACSASAMEAGPTNNVWTLEELIEQLGAAA